MEADEESIAEFESAAPAPPAEEKRNFNLPFLLTLVALLIWFGFQTLQLLRERTSMSLAKESQESALQESQKIQAQFQTIMSKTAELAAKGHAGAKMVIEELQKRGVGLAPETKSPDKPEPKAAAKPDIKSLK